MGVTPGPAAIGRWNMLAVLALVELLGMSLWFAPNAVRDLIGARWHLDPAQLGALTMAVQLGFVAGTAMAALLNLADLWSSRYYLAASALLASAANGALLFAPGFHAGLLARFLTGVFLAGVYPPGMKMAATWFREGRGLAIGIMVGALGLGKAMPYLVHAIGLKSVEFVIITTSIGAVIAAVSVITLYRDGPYPFERRAFDIRLVATVLRDRNTRLATAGYLGHMWELYAMWTWIPVFISASLARAPGADHARTADLASFAVLATGAAGCAWGGLAARRLGYARVVTLSMAASGTCALLIGALFGRSPWLVIPAVCVWGFFVVADSAQFSAMVTEVAPPHAVGTALTLQTSLGFLLTIVTIALIPVMVDAVGWPWAFPVLALGPASGIAAIARLQGRHSGR